MYIIKGFHPESDDEWIEEGEYKTPEEANNKINELPLIDGGHGHYEIWNKELDIKVEFIISKYE